MGLMCWVWNRNMILHYDENYDTYIKIYDISYV